MKIMFQHKLFFGILLITCLGVGFTMPEFYIFRSEVKKENDANIAILPNINTCTGIIILPLERHTVTNELPFDRDFFIYSPMLNLSINIDSDGRPQRYSVSSPNDCDFTSVIYSGNQPSNSSDALNPSVSVLPRNTTGANLLRMLCRGEGHPIRKTRLLTVHHVNDNDHIYRTRFYFEVNRSIIHGFYGSGNDEVCMNNLRRDLCFRVDCSRFESRQFRPGGSR